MTEACRKLLLGVPTHIQHEMHAEDHDFQGRSASGGKLRKVPQTGARRAADPAFPGALTA
jgi:hypothetical protein